MACGQMFFSGSRRRKSNFLWFILILMESEPCECIASVKFLIKKKKRLGCVTPESIFDDSGTVSLLLSLLRKILLYVLCWDSLGVLKPFFLHDAVISNDIWIPFASFSSIAVTRTSKTMLNKSSESGHPCLVPDLRGSAISFSPLSIKLAVGLSLMVFIMLSYVLSMPTF